jgi:GIY-YIG catalytic domain
MLNFKHALSASGIDPSDVCLLRHQHARADAGHDPYQLFLNDTEAFDVYQSAQGFKNRARLKASYWASFVGTPDKGTLFCGLYSCRYVGVAESDLERPCQRGVFDRAGEYDRYDLSRVQALSEYKGLLLIEWGDGFRSWIQRNCEKRILELHREFKEPSYPGHLAFIRSLSELRALPVAWIEVLRNTKGIYLLTCPKTKEQYVGKASGENGFWGRWQDYINNSHGGNIILKARDPSDYRVSILETAGTGNEVELDALESRWKQKLQSREMGLNAN